MLIADDIEETRIVIKKILNLEDNFFEIVGEAQNGEEALMLIPKIKPDVVLMDINMPVLNGLEATEKITNDFPNIIVIIMSVQAENEYLKKAMFFGAKEYIIKPFNYDTLVNTIITAYEKYKDRYKKEKEKNLTNKDAKLITFFSSKGGVGKSVLALNSAITLNKKFNYKTILLDFDLQFGDISMLVNKYNGKNILELVDEGVFDSYEAIKPYLYEYRKDLDILFAPKKPEGAEYIGKDSIEKIINFIKKEYDFIIMDTGINFNDITLYVLDISDYILYISTMELSSLKNTKIGLGVMQSLGYDKNKVKLIVNEFNDDFGISKKDVEELFKDSIFTLIPEDRKNIILSVNMGEPICESDKYLKSKATKAIHEMCKKLVT